MGKKLCNLHRAQLKAHRSTEPKGQLIYSPVLAKDERSLITEQTWQCAGGVPQALRPPCGLCALSSPSSGELLAGAGRIAGQRWAMGSGGSHCSVHAFGKEISLSGPPGAPLAATLAARAVTAGSEAPHGSGPGDPHGAPHTHTARQDSPAGRVPLIWIPNVI